jgi:hypothetical protein
LNHTRIEVEDIEKGLRAFSTDLLEDISYEIKDIEPEAGDVLFAFIDSSSVIGEKEIRNKLEEFKVREDHIDKLFDLLLWYGFLGLQFADGEAKFIYDLNYHMELLKGIMNKRKGQLSYAINPAFWSALMISQQDGS